MNTFLSKLTPPPGAWRGAALGVFFATLALGIISTLDLIKNNVSFGQATVYFAVGSLITAFVGAFLVFLWLLFVKMPSLYKWTIACFAFIVYYFFIPSQTSFGIFLVAIWTLVTFSLVGGALWVMAAAIFNREKTDWPKTILALSLGLLGIGILAWWLYINNTPFNSPPNLEGKRIFTPIPLPDPALPGSLPIKTLSYGSGQDADRDEYGKNASIITPTVNANPFLKGWKGLVGWLHTNHWGFDPSNTPLNARVWYPEGPGPFPLVVIVHGRHTMDTPSEQGYAYLGTLFASRGFITASIDQNFLNASWMDIPGDIDELAARGWLILEHLKLWKQWNETSGNPFHNNVDMQHIALIGHSRGGEAIITAAAFNNLDHFPDDGNIHFDYHFNIEALAAIAPVNSQYAPGGAKKTLENINYFTLHGSHDGDVRSFGGAAQYRRIKFTDDAYHFKAALYIFGANHGQFNTLWGRLDLGAPVSHLFNLNQIMPAEEQQQIAKVYLTAYLEATLHKNTGYLPLFQSYRFGQHWLPKTLYLNEFADSHQVYITSEPVDIDISKTQLAGGTIEAQGFDIWKQDQILLRDSTPLRKGIFLGWNNAIEARPPTYTINLPENKLHVTPTSSLVLSLADSAEDYEDEKDVPGNLDPIDFTIELTDSAGNKASLPLSNYVPLQPVIEVQVMKADWLDPLDPSESVFQTFDFPLADFIAVNPSFETAGLKTIRLIFNRTPQGIIILESIAIR